MERRFLLNIVIAQSATILELLAGKDQALLVRGNALLVLNLALDVVDRVAALHLKCNCLSGLLTLVGPWKGDRTAGKPTSVLTKICIPPRRRRTRWSVDSF
jgi:hypothetical protein